MRDAPDFARRTERDRNLKGGKNGGTEEDREKACQHRKRAKLSASSPAVTTRATNCGANLAARGNPADVIDAAIAPLAESGLQIRRAVYRKLRAIGLESRPRRTQNPRRLALAWHPGSLGPPRPESRRRAMASPSRRSSAQALWRNAANESHRTWQARAFFGQSRLFRRIGVSRSGRCKRIRGLNHVDVRDSQRLSRFLRRTRPPRGAVEFAGAGQRIPRCSSPTLAWCSSKTR